MLTTFSIDLYTGDQDDGGGGGDGDKISPISLVVQQNNLCFWLHFFKTRSLLFFSYFREIVKHYTYSVN